MIAPRTTTPAILRTAPSMWSGYSGAEEGWKPESPVQTRDRTPRHGAIGFTEWAQSGVTRVTGVTGSGYRRRREPASQLVAACRCRARPRCAPPTRRGSRRWSSPTASHGLAARSRGAAGAGPGPPGWPGPRPTSRCSPRRGCWRCAWSAPAGSSPATGAGCPRRSTPTRTPGCAGWRPRRRTTGGRPREAESAVRDLVAAVVDALPRGTPPRRRGRLPAAPRRRAGTRPRRWRGRPCPRSSPSRCASRPTRRSCSPARCAWCSRSTTSSTRSTCATRPCCGPGVPTTTVSASGPAPTRRSRCVRRPRRGRSSTGC